MNKISFCLLSLTFTLLLVSWKSPDTGTTLSTGTQPQVTIDPQGVIRIAFGRNDSIFCAMSANQGVSFSVPVFVGKVTGMHLGMSRGPQIASSLHTSLITAMDKAGDIHFFQLDNKSGKWTRKGYVNDLRSSAPEGLMGLAADNQDQFYAVWLDTRKDKKNNIYFSSLSTTQNLWSKNALVYQSPDGHVCECCKPNIAVRDGKVAIMFRNWLSGSRDLYLLQSVNAGRNFSTAQKLGQGTWPLNGCPMDGGGLVFDDNGNIQTTWQRQGIVYTCRPGEPEIKVVNGRGCTIARAAKNDKWIITYQQGENAKMINAEGRELSTVKGSFMKPLLLNNGKIFYVWEFNKTILFKQS